MNSTTPLSGHRLGGQRPAPRLRFLSIAASRFFSTNCSRNWRGCEKKSWSWALPRLRPKVLCVRKLRPEGTRPWRGISWSVMARKTASRRKKSSSFTPACNIDERYGPLPPTNNDEESCRWQVLLAGCCRVALPQLCGFIVCAADCSWRRNCKSRHPEHAAIRHHRHSTASDTRGGVGAKRRRGFGVGTTDG